MPDPHRVGVFLCRGGEQSEQSPDFERLRSAAEAAVGSNRVFEIGRACQAESASQLVKLAQENELETLVLGACPLAGGGGFLLQTLASAGLDPEAALILDLFDRPNGRTQGCAVHSGAAQALGQTLAGLPLRLEAEVEEFKPFSRVLVLGQGLAALLSARNLAQAGYPVLLLTSTKRLAPPEPLWGAEASALAAELAEAVKADERVAIIRQGELKELDGTLGQFTVRLADSEGQVQEHQVGAVVVAQGPVLRPNLGWLGLEPSERVISLSELVGLVNSPENLKRFTEGRTDFSLAVSLGLGAESWPQSLRAALEAALALKRQHGIQAVVLTGNAKVAAPDLEVLSQQARYEGVLLFKFSRNNLQAQVSPEGISLSFQDEIMNRPVEHQVDLLVYDETPDPGPDYFRLAERLGLSVGSDGRLQPDQINALPTMTGRAGVFTVGEARGSSDLDGQMDEVREALLEIRRLLQGGQVQFPAARLKVDRKKCAVCLTCIRVCPVKAMGILERRPWSNPLACVGCGTCASECPQDAIQLFGDNDERFEAEIKSAAEFLESDQSAEPGQGVLVFMCANSAGRAFSAARCRGLGWPEGVSLIEVPCAAKIDAIFVLDALRRGFDGVLILSCFQDACYSLKGVDWARLRVAHLKNLLAEAGHDPRRLVQAEVGPIMSGEAIQLIERFKEELAGLGPNPIKVGAGVRDNPGRVTAQQDEGLVIQS